MTFAKSIGGLLKQNKNSNPFVYHARRCTSSSKHCIGAKITVDGETLRSRRPGFMTPCSEENATRPVYCIHQKGRRCYSSGSIGSLSSQISKSTIPTARPSMNYLAMQYLLHTKNKMHFDTSLALNHFVVPAPSLADSTENDESKQQNLAKRIRSRIAFLLQSSACDKKPSTENKKELIDFIRSANDLRFAGAEKSGVSLFPYSGATLFFARDSVNLYGKINYSEAREQLLAQLKKKCWNLMGSEKVTESIQRFIDKGEMAKFQKGMEMMLEVILRNRRVPYGYNSYLNEVKKMRSFVSNATNTNTVIESVKIKSIYQSASLIAQDIAVQMRSNKVPFRSIFSRIVKDIPLNMPKGVEGIRITCSGRLGGVEIARTECGKYGKTSRSSFSHKIDYARAEVPTRYGNLGVKVWISYTKDNKLKRS